MMPTETITIQARPLEVAIHPGKTAVIVVDMQNDFGSPGGLFDRAGIDISGVQAAVEPTSRVLQTARRADIPVVYLKMGFRENLSDLGQEGEVNHDRHLFFGAGQNAVAPNGTESRVLIRETWNTDIIDELSPEPGDTVIYKHRFSGFFETDLDERLRNLGIRDLLFTGCTTSVCVESTVRDAMFRGYRCIVLEDCTAEPIGDGLPRSNHEASLLVVEQLFGWVSNSVRVTEAFEREVVTVGSASGAS